MSKMITHTCNVQHIPGSQALRECPVHGHGKRGKPGVPLNQSAGRIAGAPSRSALLPIRGLEEGKTPHVSEIVYALGQNPRGALAQIQSMTDLRHNPKLAHALNRAFAIKDDPKLTIKYIELQPVASGGYVNMATLVAETGDANLVDYLPILEANPAFGKADVLEHAVDLASKNARTCDDLIGLAESKDLTEQQARRLQRAMDRLDPTGAEVVEFCEATNKADYNMAWRVILRTPEWTNAQELLDLDALTAKNDPSARLTPDQLLSAVGESWATSVDDFRIILPQIEERHPKWAGTDAIKTFYKKLNKWTEGRGPENMSDESLDWLIERGRSNPAERSVHDQAFAKAPVKSGVRYAMRAPWVDQDAFIQKMAQGGWKEQGEGQGYRSPLEVVASAVVAARYIDGNPSTSGTLNKKTIDAVEASTFKSARPSDYVSWANAVYTPSTLSGLEDRILNQASPGSLVETAYEFLPRSQRAQMFRFPGRTPSESQLADNGAINAKSFSRDKIITDALASAKEMPNALSESKAEKAIKAIYAIGPKRITVSELEALEPLVKGSGNKEAISTFKAVLKSKLKKAK